MTDETGKRMRGVRDDIGESLMLRRRFACIPGDGGILAKDETRE
jgi:hypothetical protein